MKYANRYGDQRQTLPRVNDFIQMNGKFYRINDVLNAPSVKLDLTPTGTKVAGYLSAGSLATGTLLVPTPGTKISPAKIVPMIEKELMMALIAVIPQKAIVGGNVGGIPIFAGGTNVDAMTDISCEVRYWNPQESPMWLTPDAKDHATIDHLISPPEDPCEFFPIFAKLNDTPYFQAINKNGVICGCVINLHPVFRFKIEEVADKPAAFYPIPGGDLPECKGA